VFGRATITLGIGPHSSFFCFVTFLSISVVHSCASLLHGCANKVYYSATLNAERNPIIIIISLHTSQ